MSDNLLEQAHALHRGGQIDDAARLYHEVLRANPRHFEALYALGGVYFARADFEKAQYLIGEALALDPFFVEGFIMRGIALMHLKQHEQAIAIFDKALAVSPGLVDAISNRATALIEMKRYEEALAGFDQAVAIDPGHAVSWNNRGNALHELRRHKEAVESYDRALAIAPDFAEARQNRLYSLGELNRGGPGFGDVLVAQAEEAMHSDNWNDAEFRLNEALALDPGNAELRAQRKQAALNANRNEFDKMAPRFEAHLSALEYRAPEQLRALADAAIPNAAAPMDILDLGCGTGLCGDAFKDLAGGGRLDGIDISANMMELARARGIYTELVLRDLEEVLTEPGRSYDLIVSADTLIYFGELDTIVTGSFAHLKPGGFFLFAVESKDGEGWEQTHTYRYRHSEAYLSEMAARAGFEFVQRNETVLRLERNVPVPGFAVALRKPG